jgi:hypothetical protein
VNTPAPETELDAILAGPLHPRVRFVAASSRRPCRCPHVRLDEVNGEPVDLRKVLHAVGCKHRDTAPAPAETATPHAGHSALTAHLAGLPRPIPCPACGNVAFTLTPEGRRRCAGPEGRACGATWSPEGSPAGPEPPRTPEKGSRVRTAARAVFGSRTRTTAARRGPSDPVRPDPVNPRRQVALLTASPEE